MPKPTSVALGSHDALRAHSPIRGYTSAAIVSHQTPDHQTTRPPDTLPRGLTLVEMLVSLVCVILLMLAYTQLFAEAGARINDARGAIEMTNRVRSAVQTLRSDLVGITVETMPWQRPESGSGMIEIVEGPSRDSRVLNDPLTSQFDESVASNYPPIAPSDSFPLGDTDDLMMFTSKAKSGQFTGRVLVGIPTGGGGYNYSVRTTTAESAVVMWFLRPTVRPDPTDTATPNVAKLANDPTTYTLYRRAFLIVPSNPDGSAVQITNAQLQAALAAAGLTSISELDHSLHAVGTTAYAASTLADVTKRENRFGHVASFPHLLNADVIVPYGGLIVTGGGGSRTFTVDTANPRYAEDVVLSNVLGFDVQVWDPTAPVYIRGNAGSEVAVAPGDPGFPVQPGRPLNDFIISPPNEVKSIGAYVDLNWHNFAWNGTPVFAPWNSSVQLSPFYSQGHPKSMLLALPYHTYDSWSFHYEHDGIDQDNDGLFDEGTDGFDNDTPGSTDPLHPNAVDDPGERETSPPYPVPLRGIKVRIRVYEPDTRQIREVSVEHSFVPD